MPQDTPIQAPPSSPAPPLEATPLTPPAGTPTMEAPAAETLEEAPAAPAGPQPLDPPHLLAAVAEAMVLSGLGNKANLVETFLMGSMSRFVHDGTVDLGLLWQTLVSDMFLNKEKTAQTLLLTAIYVAATFQVPVAVPQDAQGLMETLLPTAEERATAGVRLAAAVEARLQRQHVERSGGDAAAAASGKDAKDTKDGVKDPKDKAKDAKDKAKDAKDKAKEKDKRAEAAKVAEQHAHDKKQPRGRLRLDDPRIAAVSGFLLLIMAGYWFNELVLKEMQLDKKRQEFYASKPVEADIFPPGIPVKDASVAAAVLKVHLADDQLAKMPEQQRAQVAADILASLERVGALRLQLFSDAKRYIVRKDADGLVTVQVFNSE